MRWRGRYRKSIAHIRQSKPGSGLGFQVKVVKLFRGVPSSLDSGWKGAYIRVEQELSLSLSRALSLSLCLSLSLSVSLPPSLSLALSLSLSFAHARALALSFSLALPLSLFLPPFFSLTRGMVQDESGDALGACGRSFPGVSEGCGYRGTSLIGTTPPYDPTVEPCLGPYGGPRGVAVSSE